MLQVGIGLKLAIRGFKLALFSGPGNEWRGWTGSEGLILSLTAAVYLLLTVVKRARAPDSAQACDRDSCSSSENETVGSYPPTHCMKAYLHNSIHRQSVF